MHGFPPNVNPFFEFFIFDFLKKSLTFSKENVLTFVQ